MSFSILFPTNEYTTSNKSPEQIQKLIIPQDFSIQSVLLHIMTKGISSQMPYLYTYFYRAFRNLISFICARASQEQSQNQILIAHSFKKIVDEQFEVMTHKEMLLLFDTCLECLNNLQSSSNEEMIGVLETIIKKYINYRELFKRMEEKALELGRPTQPIISRITSCRIISVLSKYLNRTLKVEMVDIVKRLSNQNQIEAKKVWLMEIFPKLIHNLDLDFIELHFQEKIYETVWGENQEICRLALQAIFKNVTKFSLQEQSSRIVKLFIDSLTSKSEKTAIMTTELIGEIYQKLQNVILKSESNCIRFWKSLIQLSQSKNQRILNNLIYNLYGILSLSTPHHRVDPLCDIYISLFYSPISNKLTLSSYFHEMVRLFPSRAHELKDVVMWMFSEILGEQELTDEAYKIINKIIDHLSQCYYIFLADGQQSNPKEDGSDSPRYFQQKFCQNLIKYLSLLQNKKISSWINSFYSMIFKCSDYFSPIFIDQVLLPKLYLCMRNKTVNYELVTEIMVKLISRDTNPLLINTYMSKISSEMSKSPKSHQREIAIMFINYVSFYFSLEMFYEYKLGEKYLSFNNDKVFRVKAKFINYLPRIYYFLNKEERLEYSIILTRLAKDQDAEIVRIIEGTRFFQNEGEGKSILCASAVLREREKERMSAGNTRRQQTYIGRSNKELRKEEVLKKRIETTKTKNKPFIKEIPKKRLTPLLTKTGSNFHLQKRS